MEDLNSHSPPLAPDRGPSQASQHQPRVQPFQDPFVAPTEQQRATTSRSRERSTSKPVLQQPQPQPIRDAVDRAFGQSQPPNTLDPQFIAQVTEAVVKNLQSANLNQRTPVSPHKAQYPPPPSVHSVPQSPTHSSTTSLPPRYTPPSPSRSRDRVKTGSWTSGSPVDVGSDAESTTSKASTSHDRSQFNDRDGDTPKPNSRETVTGSGLNDGNREQDADRLSRAEEGHAYPTNEASAHVEATTLERIWQPLFDNGAPTVRLSQFLRGIALHIIEEYEPKGSMVITPPKMLRFFEQTKIEDELYPWQLIFGGGMVSASISVMFRRLKCQHHLVQTQLHEVPNVPGLTPAGFETFLTCLIQAHPDLEFERLSNAVKNMPISNADYKTERFPKELSRRLLPSQPNPIAEQCIVASMAHEANTLHLKNSNAMPPPPPSAPPQHSAFPERERKPYSQSSFSAEANDDATDDPVSSVPIERERKPYSAKEGTGKIFASESMRDDPVNMTYPRPNHPASSRTPIAPQYDYNATGGAPESRTAPPPRKHRSSVGPGVPPASQPPGAGYAKSRRSPPPTASHVRSDPVNIGDIPAAQYASNLPTSRTPGYPEREQDNLNYHFNRHGSNPANSMYDDEMSQGRARPIPNRMSQAPPPADTSFDSPYGSASTGSYTGPRARNYDRRSMYGGPPPLNTGGSAGGSDGWGSYADGSGAPGIYPSQQGYGNVGSQH